MKEPDPSHNPKQPKYEMPLFHEAELSGCDVGGKLFLHSMPGRFESISEFVIAMGAEKIYRILCLVNDAEIKKRSPNYLKALENEVFRKRVLRMPIEDFGTPAEMKEVRGLMEILATALRAGKNVLIHCSAGVGRTGTMAICLLTDLGIGVEEATKRVRDAQSEPETEEQEQFIRRYSGGGRGGSRLG